MAAGLRRTWRWLTPATAFVVSLAFYLITAPRGLTWAHQSADGGDLIAAALVGGVPHPTGYPTFTLLARLLNLLPWGSAAWRVTLLSAVGGALAAAAVAATVQQVAPAIARTPGSGGDAGVLAPPSVLQALAALAAGLMLAFSPLLWSQATVAEVYALQAGLAAALIAALAAWYRRGRRRWAASAGLLLGLALGNHLTAAWLMPLVLTVFLAAPRNVARRSLAPFLAAAAAGLLVYAYLPAAAAGAPPINWGDPRTPAGFLWLVSGQLYRPFAFAVATADVLPRLSAWAALLLRDFGPWGAALAIVGLNLSWRQWPGPTVGAVITLLLSLAWAIGYNTTDSMLTLLPAWVLIAIWAGIGLTVLVGWLGAQRRWGGLLAALICIALFVLPLARFWPQQDLRQERRAEDFIDLVMSQVEPDSLVVTAGDRATFSLWYARYGLERRPDVALVSRDLWREASYRATVGRTHPALAGTEPPAALGNLLRATLAVRPVYLAQPPAPVDLASLGLSADEVAEVELLGGDELDGPLLWRLEPPPVDEQR